MMVGKGEWSQLLDNRIQVVRHLLRRGNACQKQHMVAFELRQSRSRRNIGSLIVISSLSIIKHLGLFEDRLQLTIVNGSEEQLLIGIEAHCLSDDTILHGFEVLGAFGDNHDIRAILSTQWFAQSASRQQCIIDNQSVIIYQQDVDARFDLAMLEGII